MQIVKDKRIVDDNWRYVADDAELPSGDVTVSLTRWQQLREQLHGHDGRIGVRIGPEDVAADMTGDIEQLPLIELDFPKFADGRLFSLAWLLRSRYRYRGELRATGHYLPGQVFYLSRVGVNAFKPEKAEQLAVIIEHLDDFSVRYQASVN